MSGRAKPRGEGGRLRRVVTGTRYPVLRTPYSVPRTPRDSGFVPPWGDRPSGLPRTLYFVLCTLIAASLAMVSGVALAQSGGEPEGTFTWSVRPTPTEEFPERVNFMYD